MKLKEGDYACHYLKKYLFSIRKSCISWFAKLPEVFWLHQSVIHVSTIIMLKSAYKGRTRHDSGILTLIMKCYVLFISRKLLPCNRFIDDFCACSFRSISCWCLVLWFIKRKKLVVCSWGGYYYRTD